MYVELRNVTKRKASIGSICSLRISTANNGFNQEIGSQQRPEVQAFTVVTSSLKWQNLEFDCYTQRLSLALVRRGSSSRCGGSCGNRGLLGNDYIGNAGGERCGKDAAFDTIHRFEGCQRSG